MLTDKAITEDIGVSIILYDNEKLGKLAGGLITLLLSGVIKFNLLPQITTTIWL